MIILHYNAVVKEKIIMRPIPLNLLNCER